ncbi:YadA-like family protein [Avibacterium sp. 21-586]|uniref:YadA family autotransporter adhesin n=1 Tax=Avibacterium sp. 21-586 TaxID=2911534 RepID=UPI0022459B22|nr:YadA family autotransporter adhesin [Avibacterium sp. 21-586]MCW9709588.1 YadA-like family protein [Avibacterium sp. 21-586]
MNNDLFSPNFKRDEKHVMRNVEISRHPLSYKNLKKLNRTLSTIFPHSPAFLLFPALIGAVSINANAAIRDGSTGEKITISSPDRGASNYSPNGIAIGNGSYIEDMGPDTKEGIAIGTNAKALDGNSTPRTGLSAIFFGSERKNLPGGVSGIAIGLNTYASESTVDIGAKSGGSEANGANRRASVTVGADSYAAAHFSTITGAYSSIKTTPSRDDSPSLSGLGSVISGALNTMDVKKYETYNGMANAITGTANLIKDSNGALIMGTGNKISNSRLPLRLSALPAYDNITNSNKLYELLSEEDSNGKKPELASVGVFGGANEVDNAHFVNVSGVDNRLKGAESGTSSEYVSIDGYRNRATNVSHLSMQGSENAVTNATENIVMGNYNKVIGDKTDRSDAKRNLLFGFQDENSNKIGKNIANNQLIGSDITVKEGTKNGVLIGDQAEIAASNMDDTTALDGAIALGAKSVANRQAIDSASVETSTDKIPENNAAKTNKVYALEAASDDDKTAIKATVKGNLAAISVGNAKNTRQIINVAAGSEDTDAVNVAQLRSVANVLNENTWSLSVNNDTKGKESVGNKNTVNFINTDDNITITKTPKDENGKINVDMILKDQIRIGAKKVIQGDGSIVKEGGTIINGDGLSTNDGKGPSITTTGIDAKDTKITHVRAGQNETDAVNMSQLNAVKTDVSNIRTDVNLVKNDLINVKGDINNVKTDINNVKADVNNVKADVNNIKTDVNNVKTDVNNVKADVNNVKGDINNVKNQVESITHTTWNLSANDKDKVNIGTADTVNFKNTDKNINIVKSSKDNNKIDVDMTLNDTVNIKEKVNVGSTNGTSINKDGLTTNGGNGPSIKTIGVNAGNKVITNVAAGVAPTDAVNVSQLDGVKNQLNNVLNTNWSISVNDNSPETITRTDTVNIKNSDNNIKLVKTRNGNKVNVNMKLNDTVRIGGQNGTVINNSGIMTNGGNGPSITTTGVNAGGKRIRNVTAGVRPTDAVNVSQLNGVKRQIDNVDKSARAGIAGALATANLYQAYIPGHSMVSVGVGTFRGQNAIAIGASRLSDNGHIGIKLSGMTTNQGDVGGAMAVGYQW